MFLDSIGGFFTNTLPHAVEDVINTSWSAGKTVTSTVWNGAVSATNRVADVAERGANKGIDAAAGFGNLLSNPLLVGGGIILALMVMAKL